MPPEPESPWLNIAAIVGGAGATGLISSQITKYVPQLTPEIAGGGTGVVLYLYGGRLHPVLRYLGIGILAGALMPRIGGILGGLAPTTPTTTPTTGKTAAELAAQAYAQSR